MTDQEAIEIIYGLVVKLIRGPLDDRSLDAIFHIRAMIEAREDNEAQKRDKGGLR